MQEEPVDPFVGVRRIMCIGASRLPPQASSSASHSLDFFGLVTDTAPLSQSSESEREANALTVCGSVVRSRSVHSAFIILRSAFSPASHPDHDRAGDFLLKNLEAIREESSSRALANSLPPPTSEA
jgi:hypothetical protein